MSEFPISDVVTVNITRETLFPTREGFGVLLIAGTTDVIDQGERVRFYSSPEAVAADFSSTDEEQVAALAAFSQNPRPTLIAIGRVLTADAPGYVKGGAVGTLSAFQAVTDGEFEISIDAVANDITGVDFSSDNSIDEVAATIQAAIRAIATGGYTLATCVNEDGRFKISSGTITNVLPLTPIAVPTGTDISGTTYLNLQSNVSVVIEAHIFTDFTGELDAIEERNDDWYGLALTRDLQSNANYDAASIWAEARLKLLAAFDDSLIAKDSLSVLDLPFLNKASGYTRTFTHWNNDGTTYPEVSEIVRILTVDYNIPNSAITLKFQQLPGITAITATPSERNALLGKNAEIYVTRGGVNHVEEGKVAVGEFIDVIHSVDFMQTQIALQVFGLLFATSTKIPMTDSGVAQIEDAVKIVLDIATAAGIIAEDFDEDGNLVPAFVITAPSVLSIPPSQRAQRISPAVSFVARLAGAIHFVTVSGTVTV
ncbi:MAG: DUF3383 family protein [Nannocystaceae bacterium]